MSSDLLYSLGLDITDFKTSAKASKESADDIKKSFKGLKDVLAAGGVATAVLGFFSQVVDYAQNSKGKLDENTAAVKRFGDAIDQAKDLSLKAGTLVLGTFNRLGEAIGDAINIARFGWSQWAKDQDALAASTAAAEAAERSLADAKKKNGAEFEKITTSLINLKKQEQDLSLQGITAQETYNNNYQAYLDLIVKQANFSGPEIERRRLELQIAEAHLATGKARLVVDKEAATEAKKNAEADDKALTKSISDYNKLGEVKKKQLDYELSKKPLEEQSEVLTRRKLELETKLLDKNISITDENEIRNELLDVTKNLDEVSVKQAEKKLKTEKEITAEKEKQITLRYTASDGTDTQALSDRQLAELLTTTQQTLSAARRTTPQFIGSDNGAAFIENRVAQIQREISERQRFRSDYARQGEGAFANRSAFEEDRFRRYITPEDEQRQKDQAKNIGDISENLRRLINGGRG
jgi:hypothetical protein